MTADADLFADEVRAQACAAGTELTDHAKDGLASDHWWRDCRLSTATTCRQWVRLQLLEDAHMTDHDCDRFIASLSPVKREDLIRRAVNGHGPGRF